MSDEQKQLEILKRIDGKVDALGGQIEQLQVDVKKTAATTGAIAGGVSGGIVATAVLFIKAKLGL